MSVAARSTRRKNAEPVPAADPKLLLAWYDRHRRVLPWRARRGERADPYAVWLSEIMLQQTNVTTVAPYYAKFLARWPTVKALAKAPLDDVLKMWAGLGYYARARNLYACAVAVTRELGGKFPDTVEGLRALPGIGAYTASAIASIAFDRAAVPVDGNVERVVTRLYAIEEKLPAAKPLIQSLASSIAPSRRHGDFAQALMDLGAMICTPKKPACVLCPWRENCVAFARGDQETFPRKGEKREGKLRRGAAFVVVRADGALLARTRPAKGLLGGMTEVPTTEWSAEFVKVDVLGAAPLRATWRKMPTAVRHVFTHFPLELTVYRADLPQRTKAPAGMRFLLRHEIAGAAFPSVFRKVVAAAGLES